MFKGRRDGYCEPLDPQEIARLRQLSGEQRFRRALSMINTVWRIAADAVRNESPDISPQQLQDRLRERRR